MQDVITYPFNLKLPDPSSSMRMFNITPVVVYQTQDRRIDKTHWHDFLQIWYTVSGNYLHYVNGVPYLQKPGSAILIFPYMLHHIDSSASDLTETQVVRISVKRDSLEGIGAPYLPYTFNTAYFDGKQLPVNLSFNADKKKLADSLCLDLLAEFEKQAGMQSYRLLKLVAQFLALCSEHSKISVSKKTLQVVREKNGCMDEAMRFLVHNHSQRITLDDAAGAAMMSRSHFSASFKAATGQTYHTYLRALRMKNAIDMLQQTKNSIGQIAEEAGFYDDCHFRKTCIDMYNTTPLDIRRKLSQWKRCYGDSIFRNTMQRTRWAISYEESIKAHECSMSFY